MASFGPVPGRYVGGYCKKSTIIKQHCSQENFVDKYQMSSVHAE